jgi:MFS family permease
MAFGYNAVSKILPAFLTSITSSALQISFVSSAYNIGKILSGSAGGVFADWFGKKNTITVSMIFLGFFSGLLVLWNTIEWFILIFFFLGVFASLFYLSMNSIMTIVNKKKAKALSKLEMSYQVGFIVGPLIGGAIAASQGMNPIFLFWTALMFIGVVFVRLINFEDSGDSVKRVAKNYTQVIRTNPLNFITIVLGGSVFLGIVEGARDILIPLYAADLGFDLLGVGAIFMGSSIITLIGLGPFSGLADKVGRKTILIFSFILVGLSFLLLGFLTSIIFLAVLTGLLSLGRTTSLTGIRAFASDISESNVRATSLAIVEMGISVGRIVGAVLAGLLKDLLMIGPTLWIFFWASVILVVTYVVIFLVKRN